MSTTNRINGSRADALFAKLCEKKEKLALTKAEFDEVVNIAKRDGIDVSTWLADDRPAVKAWSVKALVAKYPTMRPIVIDGILRRGETANFIAAAKIGKSFLAANLAWSVASGLPWLGRDVRQGRVLILDNELHPETLASRLCTIGRSMGIDVDEVGESIDVISLRGLNVDINGIESALGDIKAGTYGLVLLDALYRTLPSGTSENDNAAMMAIYNRLDRYAAQWDASVCVVHHASKGQQGDKSVTDVGSGAGSISRAVDTHLVIRPHEDPELAVLECVTRSFRSPSPMSVRFDWPLWSVVDVAPEVKQVGRNDKAKQAKADEEAAALMLEKIPMMPKRIQQNELFDLFPFGVTRCKRLAGKLISDDLIKVVRKKKKTGTRRYVFYCRPQSDSDSDSDSGSNARIENQNQ